MKNNTMTAMAWTPSLGMSGYGHPCAQRSARGAAVVGNQGAPTATIARVKNDFPGTCAWRPPRS